QHLLAAGADRDLLDRILQVVVALELRTDGLAQRDRARDRRVLRLAAIDRGLRRVLDVARRVEIRLARAEADDFDAGRLHLGDLAGQRIGRRGLDARHAL